MGGALVDDLRDGETPVVMMFAEGDEGIEYLRHRLSRRLAHVQRRGGLRVVKVEGIDHSMHRTWLRPLMIEVLAGQLATLVRPAPAAALAGDHSAAGGISAPP
jgi:hypothetical protein